MPLKKLEIVGKVKHVWCASVTMATIATMVTSAIEVPIPRTVTVAIIETKATLVTQATTGTLATEVGLQVKSILLPSFNQK
jgi:hypothetical protein